MSEWCLSVWIFKNNDIYKKFIDTFMILLKYIDNDFLDILIEAGFLKCLNSLVTSTIKISNDKQIKQRKKAYHMINMIICRNQSYADLIFRHVIREHICSVNDDFGLLEMIPIKRNLLLSLKRNSRLIFLSRDLFMENMIKTLDICWSINQTQWWLEIFKEAMNSSFNPPCWNLDGLWEKFITIIWESPIIRKIEELRYSPNWKIEELSNSVLEFIEKAQVQELERSKPLPFSESLGERVL